MDLCVWFKWDIKRWIFVFGSSGTLKDGSLCLVQVGHYLCVLVINGAFDQQCIVTISLSLYIASLQTMLRFRPHNSKSYWMG